MVTKTKASTRNRRAETLLLPLNWRFNRGLDHFVEDLAKLFQTGGRYDHIVTASVDVFRNAKKAAPWIFFQGENKGFPFDLNFLGLFKVSSIFTGGLGGPALYATGNLRPDEDGRSFEIIISFLSLPAPLFMRRR